WPGTKSKPGVICSVAAEGSLQQAGHFSLAANGSCRDLLDPSRLFRRATDARVTLNCSGFRVTLGGNRPHNRTFRLRFLRRDLALLGTANRTQVFSINPSQLRRAWFDDFKPVVPIVRGTEWCSSRIKMADRSVNGRTGVNPRGQ